ncbi:MAG: hypothetical protein HRT68_07545 [Flavobacteriaceae bacterium]|nr:hypothetical protein [Flavobacteriaceae bacterium]
MENVTGPYSVTWNFGDGTTVVTTNQNSVVHSYGIPCQPFDYTVSAIIESNEICDDRVLTTSAKSYDPCKRRKAVAKHKVNYAGKKVRMKMKIRKRADIFGGATVFKNKMKYRKNGTKTITASGNVDLLTGTVCTPVSMASLMPTVSQSGKKKLKDKLSDGNIYFLDLNTPYSVTFSHSNGFSYTLFYSLSC